MKHLHLFFAAILLIIASLFTLPVSADGITSDGYYNGIRLAGRVKIVSYNGDIKVKVVDSFPDLRVKVVNSFPDDIGEWQFVTYGEDFTIQYVDSFPDITIKFVDAFPGVD